MRVAAAKLSEMKVSITRHALGSCESWAEDETHAESGVHRALRKTQLLRVSATRVRGPSRGTSGLQGSYRTRGRMERNEPNVTRRPRPSASFPQRLSLGPTQTRAGRDPPARPGGRAPAPDLGPGVGPRLPPRSRAGRGGAPCHVCLGL